MTVHVLTLFPEIFAGYLSSSILAKAVGKGLISIQVTNVRDFARDRHRSCDDYPYGGGAGMVLKPEPLAEAIESVLAADGNDGSGAPVVYLTPGGRLFDQSFAEKLAAGSKIILICGRYEGIDQRIIDMFVTDEISVGDYVLSGGEVGALAIIDTVARLIPGVIKEESLREESFTRGLLEYPQYTRPAVFRGSRVPEVLLQGNHAEISRWRLTRSLEKTVRLRPELLEKIETNAEMKRILQELETRGASDERDESH